LHFSLYHGKTGHKGKRLQDVKDIEENVTAELNALPLEAFAVFKNFLNNLKNLFKYAGIILNKNKKKIPCIFIFFTLGREPYRWTSYLSMTYRGVYYAASFND
jgi:hypothetical protein